MTIRRLMFGIPLTEAMFQRRGFHVARTEARLHLEEIGRVFLHGYHEAVDGTCLPSLVARLDTVAPDHRGFAYEGAAMGLALLDELTPWNRRRWPAMTSGPGMRHVYMLHVGAGWAAARLPWLRARIVRYLNRFDPLLGWLVIDGYGFHHGYFRPRAFVESQRRLRVSHTYFHRAFDQGLGRNSTGDAMVYYTQYFI